MKLPPYTINGCLIVLFPGLCGPDEGWLALPQFHKCYKVSRERPGVDNYDTKSPCEGGSMMITISGQEENDAVTGKDVRLSVSLLVG